MIAGTACRPALCPHRFARDRTSVSDSVGGRIMESTARALLGAQHPLVRVMDDMHARLEQAIALMSIIAAGAAAALTGVADTRAALAAATVVEVVLVCSLWMLAVAKRDRILDLIVEGRENLTAPFGRARTKAAPRSALPSAVVALARDAAPRGGAPGAAPTLHRPLYRRRVIAAASRELLETARALRCEHPGAAGVAMAERLLSRPDSPLYGESGDQLSVELRRCRFLLAHGPATVDRVLTDVRRVDLLDPSRSTGARPRYTRWIQASALSA